MIDEVKKSKTEVELERLTRRHKVDPLFIGTYNREAYNSIKSFIEEIYGNHSVNRLLTICSEASGCGLTTMLKVLKNELFDKFHKRLIYISGEEFVALAVQMNRTDKENLPGLLREWKSIFNNVDGIIIDDIHFIIDKQGSLERLCDVIVGFSGVNKLVILTTNLLNVDELLEMSKENALFSKLMLTSKYVQIDRVSKEDRLAWTQQCMEKYKVKTQDKLAKYYIARETLRNIKLICEALRFYCGENHVSTEYVDFSINDIHKVHHKTRTGDYMRDTIQACFALE